MPLYEYRCESCDHRFSELVRGEEQQPACPACGRHEHERLLSSFIAAPARRAPGSFTPAQTRRDGGHPHRH